MGLSMYQASVPGFVRALKSLKGFLAKGEAFAERKKADPTVLLGARLAVDMHPLTRQVQMASDTAKGAAARLAGIEPPSMADTETSFAQLQSRLDATISFLESLTPEQFDGAESREVTMKTPSVELKFSGADYLTGFAIPNNLFHVTTAYAILRHNGVDLGKMDFLGGR